MYTTKWLEKICVYEVVKKVMAIFIEEEEKINGIYQWISKRNCAYI